MTLFDYDEEALPVRTSDPATARIAARMLPVKQRKREVIRAMQRLGSRSTVAQIQSDMAVRDGILRERSTIASRLSQLRTDGLVRTAGTDVGDQGRPVTCWSLTDEGKAWDVK